MVSPAREAIKAAFLHLLESYPLREITVKKIVQDCGVNRNTFYYHFKDIPELLEEIVTEYADRIIAAQGPALSLGDCLETAARFALENRQVVLHISQSSHRDLFELHLMDVCRRVVRSYAGAAFQEIPVSPEDREVLLRFYQCACFGQIIEWINSGMRYDLQAQFRRLCQLGEGTMETMFLCAARDAQKNPPRS